MILVPVPWLPSAKKEFVTWAITLAPFVFVLKEYKDNEALLAHERKHLDQVKMYGWCVFYWKYLTNKAWRKSMEAEGYAIQRRIEKEATA